MSTPSQPETVLVIEDDRPTFLVIKGHLERAGYRVLEASHGAEGLALARSNQVALITLDVLMHPIDGWTVFRELRTDPATQKIPIVFVSVIDERPEGLIAEGYVGKPFRGHDLLKVITRALRSDS